jgi:hypothetical protein
MQSTIDRDCLIAATLAAGGVAPTTPEMMVRRFKEVLIAIRKAGGTYDLWSNSDDSSPSVTTL